MARSPPLRWRSSSENFDQAELYQFEHERKLTVALLEQWLVKYKFKNWRVTETSKTPVTRKMRIAARN